MKYLKTFEKLVIKDDYVTELNDVDVYIHNYNDQLIDGLVCEECKIYWNLRIIDNDEEIRVIEPVIKKVELRLDVHEFTHLDVENLDTKSLIEKVKVTKKGLMEVEGFNLGFPIKPKGLDLDYREKSVKIEFE